MAGGKEIRTKIKSVKSTQKITKAMEMVAASKMRRAQDRMRSARPYGDRVRTIIANLAKANTEYRHPFLVHRDPLTRVGVILVTSDKGLCGGLNTNVLRMVVQRMKELQAAGAEIHSLRVDGELGDVSGDGLEIGPADRRLHDPPKRMGRGRSRGL